MDMQTTSLTVHQATVLDIYLRLDRVALAGTTTLRVVATHSRLSLSMVQRVTAQLVELGLLAKGTEARTKRSLVLTDEGRAYEPAALPQAG